MGNSRGKKEEFCEPDKRFIFSSSVYLHFAFNLSLIEETEKVLTQIEAIHCELKKTTQNKKYFASRAPFHPFKLWTTYYLGFI